jgi:hypothetical protein
MKLKIICTGACFFLVSAGFVFIVLLPVGFLGAKAETENESSIVRVCYELELDDPVHPGISGKNFPVWLSFDQQGFPCEYQLSLQTEVCLDRVCKLLEVTLVWDALGNYSRLELAGEDPLTKKNHDPFDSGDYERLDEILKDRQSILGKYPLDFFVRPPAKSYTDEVDGVTSATPQTVRDAVVSGAAYTSWVLWHWVNGNVVEELRTRTLLYCNPQFLLYCLLSKDPRFEEFALRHILEHDIRDPQIREACFQTLENGTPENCKLALQVLTRNIPDEEELHQRLIALIGVNEGSIQWVLDYFEELPHAPRAVWEQMSRQLEQLQTYSDVNAVLNLLEKRASRTETTRLQVEKLLDRDNRFIVRRAREFLEN